MEEQVKSQAVFMFHVINKWNNKQKLGLIHCVIQEKSSEPTTNSKSKHIVIN